jgi:preprotein translocase subunit SecA
MNNKRTIKKMKSIVQKINALRNDYLNYTDDDLKKKTSELRERVGVEGGKRLLPEAFALVREASRRAIGKEHYDVQLLSGIVLYDGKIAEAKTGEGKTITIYLPAFLACLEGLGVHVVTVNDYLAKRDATEAEKVFEMLGVSVGCVLNDSTNEERIAAYKCDITYVTNTELGFDYLRDHIVLDKKDSVLRGFHYAIIDEVDSVLIDEAKTPLIISGEGPDNKDLLETVNDFVKTLKEGRLVEISSTEKLLGGEESESGDYIKNEKTRQIYLTERGNALLEKTFNIDNYGNAETLMLQRSVNNALRANYMMCKNKDYIVRDGKVEIIDAFTGRVLPGRRFSDGLHQALEVKEGVEIQNENVTIATVTFQSFFNKYKKKSGLTGTAMTSSKEFKDIYHLDVVEIPTNKPMIREDLDDLVFRTKNEKWAAVLKEVEETHLVGQPILIGTSSIEDSEIVSNMLSRKNIPHNTLNAKNEALEAEIIANAGMFGAVTVATNMAGRGTDIILDEESKRVGGLKVIGTERHDSRRIDNQLKGRSGRQGDPGTSQFFISLEDRIMRVFGDKNSMNTLMLIAVEPGCPLTYRPITKIIEKAQQAVETENRLAREHMLKYDSADNEHREQIYEQRDDILNGDNAREILEEMFYDVSDGIIDKYIDDNSDPATWDVDSVLREFFNKVTYVNIKMDTKGMTKDNLKASFRNLDDSLITLKEKYLQDEDLIRSVERNIVLRSIDRNWSIFLSSMEHVKQNIGGQAYAQRDPSMEYKKKGVELFNSMIDSIKENAVSSFMHCQIKIAQPSNDENNQSA